MTLSTTTNRVSFAGNGVTTAFSFPYYFLSNSDLVVILRNAAGTETTQTITTHYTVTGAGVSAGGTVTMITAPASGETLVIYRDPARTQDLDLVENDPMPAEELEERFDKLSMITQRLSERLDRALVLKETDSTSTLSLPLTTERASQFLAFDASGNAIAADATGDGVPVSAFMQTVLDDTTAAAARTTLGFSGASGTVAPANIEDLAVTTAKINDLAVTTGKINDLAVTTGKIAASAVTSPKLDDGTIDLINFSLAASVASNALTISLKDASGSDASATSPVKIKFRSSTAGTGSSVVRSVTGALSTVISSGSTAGHSSAVNGWLYVYAIDNAGTVELAWAGQPIFDEGSLVTTTAEGGAGAADSNTTLYSTTARSNVACRLLGRMKSNQTTAGIWAAVPTEISSGKFGRTLQRSTVRVDGANGYGSTNTKIARYSNTRINTGSAITYADSSTAGASFTINEDGVYAFGFTQAIAAGATFGISLNSTELTTSVGSITAADLLTAADATANGTASSFTMFLKAGDVLRPHGDASALSTVTYRSIFWVTKVTG